MIGEIEIASGSSPTSSGEAGSSGLETLARNQCERNYCPLYLTVYIKYVLPLVSQLQNEANGTTVGKASCGRCLAQPPSHARREGPLRIHQIYCPY